MQILPTIPRPSIGTRNPFLRRDRQRFQVGDWVRYRYSINDVFRAIKIEGVKRYKFIGKVWLIRYSVDFAGIEHIAQWRLLYQQRVYNKREGIVEAKTVHSKFSSINEVEGRW